MVESRKCIKPNQRKERIINIRLLRTRGHLILGGLFFLIVVRLAVQESFMNQYSCRRCCVLCGCNCGCSPTTGRKVFMTINFLCKISLRSVAFFAFGFSSQHSQLAVGEACAIPNTQHQLRRF